MLFDPRSFVPENDAGQPGWTSAQQHSVAGRRPAHDFLTLPHIPRGIPATARVSYGDEVDLAELVLAQFRAEVMDAEHVSNPTSAGDAFSQAFRGWLMPRMPKTKVLKFDFALIDHEAAQCEIAEFGLEIENESPLYLGIRLEEENVYTIHPARADALRTLHPSLLFSALQLIRAAAGKSLHIRTPDDLLEMFCRWHWDYELMGDDEAAREHMKERFGEDDPDIERYLPSVVRAELSPDDTLPKWQWSQKDRKLRELTRRSVRDLARQCDDWRSGFCTALADLHLALERMGNASLIRDAQWAEPAYSAATIAYQHSDYVGELLDDHFECASNGGYATYFQCFIRFPKEVASIRKQYAILEDTLNLIALLDRVLEHFS